MATDITLYSRLFLQLYILLIDILRDVTLQLSTNGDGMALAKNSLICKTVNLPYISFSGI